MRIIPAIDIIDGKCVRLSQGDYSRKKVYNTNPLEVAKEFEGHGIQYLHLVDLDGARSNRIINYKVLEAIASRTGLEIDFGGGLKSSEDVKTAFESGAKQITGGSIAVKEPEVFLEWLKHYGPERIILGSDVKSGKIAVSGWTEASDKELLPFLKDFKELGIQYTICTDVSKDGMLEGPAYGVYKDIREQLPELKLIASGGVTSVSDIERLATMGCEGVIIGKAIYEGSIPITELEGLILNSNELC